jgi:hypothetical protein
MREALETGLRRRDADESGGVDDDHRGRPFSS